MSSSATTPPETEQQQPTVDDRSPAKDVDNPANPNDDDRRQQPVPEASAMDQPKSPVEDDLDDLLASALGDFKTMSGSSKDTQSQGPSKSKAKPSKSSAQNKSTSNTGLPDLNFDQFANVDDVLNSFLDQDPQLKKHWEQLAEACSNEEKPTTDADFESSLNDTLHRLADNARKIAENSNISQEELSQIWENLGINDETAGADGGPGGGMLKDIMPLVTNLMQNMLSKEVLYPALKELTQKYPEWLDSNKDKITADDHKRYSRQLELMNQVCSEYEAEQADDSGHVKQERFQRILTVMQAMQECGSPPKELVGDVPELGQPGGPDFDFARLQQAMGAAGAGGPPGQCSLM